MGLDIETKAGILLTVSGAYDGASYKIGELPDISASRLYGYTSRTVVSLLPYLAQEDKERLARDISYLRSEIQPPLPILSSADYLNNPLQIFNSTLREQVLSDEELAYHQERYRSSLKRSSDHMPANYRVNPFVVSPLRESVFIGIIYEVNQANFLSMARYVIGGGSMGWAEVGHVPKGCLQGITRISKALQTR